MTRAEERNGTQTHETAKELRAPLPTAASPLASSLRLSDETQEQLVRSPNQARTAKKGVETLQDVSYLFQKGHSERQRHGFIQVRMAGMRKSKKKKVLKKKDGERNFNFPSCSPDVQAALRETRRTEWNKWKNFNAGVILTEIYPMKWVYTDKKRVPAKR